MFFKKPLAKGFNITLTKLKIGAQLPNFYPAAPKRKILAPDKRVSIGNPGSQTTIAEYGDTALKELSNANKSPERKNSFSRRKIGKYESNIVGKNYFFVFLR